MPHWIPLVVSVVIAPIFFWVLNNIVRDAARYLHAAATNVESRHEIRAAGLKVLNELHDRDYERIVVVGHSLGTVIGYDILCHAWAQLHKEISTDAKEQSSTKLDRNAWESLDELIQSGADTAQLRTAQNLCFAERLANGAKWRVSDFVTMGSPLAHAQILLADDARELDSKFMQREFSKCPPHQESHQKKWQRCLFNNFCSWG
jgi:hypothetical protein